MLSKAQSSQSSSVLRGLGSLNRRRKAELFFSLVLTFLLVLLIFNLSRREGGNSAHISLLIGISLGIVLERGRFCFFCIFRDAIEFKNAAPLISVFTAIATGALGYFVIFGQFLPDPSTGSLPPAAHIGPVSIVLVVAAVAFGLGMALSGACISGHLYRIGQGSLRAIPALLGSLVGFALAFITWNPLYLRFIADAPTIWLPRYIGYWGSLVLTLATVAVLTWWVIRRYPESEWKSEGAGIPTNGLALFQRLFVDRWSPLVTGSLVGIIATIAYLRVEPLGVTRQLSTLARTALENSSFAPSRIEGLDGMAGCIAIVSDVITNNGWLIFGLIVASTVTSLLGRRTSFSGLTMRNFAPTFVGGALLGWGGMTALGCTIGVLLSGTQSFALSGWVYLATLYATVALSIRFRLHSN